MLNFEFLVPTRIIFGRDTQMRVGDEIAQRYSGKVLVHFGSESARKSGLLGQVCQSLSSSGIQYVLLGGVKPNPRLSLVQEGIELCRSEGIGFILAVGGGSVIDSAKAIALGVPYTGDVWDFYCGKAVPESCLPVATVLTIPAAGSESSPSSVITNEAEGRKYGHTSELIRPVFSILNPELTYTLPAYQTACGAADIMAHVMERYFTNTKNVDFSDRLCEATLAALVNCVPQILENPRDYDARANMMWAGTVAHNDLLGRGREEDWASHNIEHELSAKYDIAHGAGLAIVFPAFLKYVMKHDVMRLAQFANRVFGITMDFGNPEHTAREGIAALENFFNRIGLPTRLSHAEIGTEALEEMANLAAGDSTIGSFVKLSREDILEILKLAI